MKTVIDGLNKGERIIAEAQSVLSGGNVKIYVEGVSGGNVNCTIGPNEAVALADGLIASVKYINANKKR